MILTFHRGEFKNSPQHKLCSRPAPSTQPETGTFSQDLKQIKRQTEVFTWFAAAARDFAEDSGSVVFFSQVK
jgi:hypothetical protein